MSAQTRQTTLSGDVTDTAGYAAGDLSGLAHYVWLAARADPADSSMRDVATVALEAHETGADVRDVWTEYLEGGR